jgi:beta-glucosidase
MRNELLTKAQQALVPVSRQAATEGMVLLENKDSALPIQPGEILSIFGRCQIDTYRSGTGSGGAVNVPYAINVINGLRRHKKLQINESLASIYQEWVEQNPFDNGGGGWAAEPWFQQEMPLSEHIVQQAAQQSDKALIIIGRTAGEDKDNVDAPGSYRLTKLEAQMISLVGVHFDHVIIVLNVTNIIDMSWLNTIENHQSIKAVLYSWAAGMEAGDALAEVVSGAVSPSGKLGDTIAYQLSDYPAFPHFGGHEANIYVEDIYTGYRYFETFKPEAVQYEFGYGLSYTQFRQELHQCSQSGEGLEQHYHFDFKVSNIGSIYSGKEVVQLYCEMPQGKLGKPAKVLIGFAKTACLMPGQTEVVRISVALSQLASYDDSGVTGHRSCYVLEAGHYRFYSGNSVRNSTLIAMEYQHPELTVTETLSEAMAPVRAFQRIKPGKRQQNGVYEIALETVEQRSVCLRSRIEKQLPEALTLTGDQGIRLLDVKQGHASLDDFIAQLSHAELAELLRGEGMCSPKVTPGTAAAFGGLSQRLFHFGIPRAAATDGPSGIRLDTGHKATQVPIGTLLSCTWNLALNQQLFNLIGQELRAYQIDNLLGPGINIHRHPLNGRNFEYFSEDAYLTGAMAAAQTLGLKSAGVSATIKHFAANDQETNRHNVDSIVSERALRELHLKGFEMAVKQGQASSIMTSYNPINGNWGASNYDLTTTILRGEWGYTGIVMSDWWAKMNHPVDGGEANTRYTSHMIRAQNDLYMVVENDGAERNSMKDDTLSGLANGQVTLGELQRSAMNVCRFLMDTPAMARPLVAYDPIKSCSALAAHDLSNAKLLENEMILSTKTNCSVPVLVDQAGVYQVSAQVNYAHNSLAQSSCTLVLNGEYTMSFSTNGTDGKTVVIEGAKVRLEPGGYQLKIEFLKPGFELERLIFTPQATSSNR